MTPLPTSYAVLAMLALAWLLSSVVRSWHRHRARQANAVAESLIAQNKFKHRPGWETVDDGLRIQTKEKREVIAAALRARRRELEKPLEPARVTAARHVSPFSRRAS